MRKIEKTEPYQASPQNQSDRLKTARDWSLMRTATAPIITNHRLGRLMVWARLWFCWFVGAFLQLASPAVQRKALDHAARIAAALIVVQTAARYRAPPRATHRHGRVKRRGVLRAAVGSSLRCALRGRDACARLAAILSVMRDMDAHVASLLHRLRRGLTRLRTIAPLPSVLPCVPKAPAMPAACADTS